MFLRIMCYFLFLAYVNADFAQDCLEAHNVYRKKHHVPELELDGGLNGDAQQWADNLKSTGTFKHAGVSGQGENLYYSSGSKLSAKAAVDSWYDEIKDYSFKKPGFSMETGHFTQVVWKSSTKLGCAYGQSGRKIYVVARYTPPGNVMGQFEDNVLESGSAIISPKYFLLLISIFCFFKFYLQNTFSM